MKGNIIMKYSQSKSSNSNIYKKKVTAFCLSPYKNFIFWKEVWLMDWVCLKNSYLIISHVEEHKP